MLIYLQMIEMPEDRANFQYIYETYYGLMYNIANRVLKNPYDAEDAVHQAFVSIAEHIKKISSLPRSELEPYIAVIVEHKAIDIIRVKQNYVDQIDFDENMWGISIIEENNSIDLATLMGRLPARFREVLILRFDIGFTTREIAKLMNITLANTQKMIWRAKHELQQLINEETDYEKK